MYEIFDIFLSIFSGMHFFYFILIWWSLFSSLLLKVQYMHILYIMSPMTLFNIFRIMYKMYYIPIETLSVLEYFYTYI